MSEIRVTDIKGENGLDAVNFSKGVSAAGIVTATGFKVGAGISMTDTGIKASNFYGSGASLTGISAGITMADQWRINTQYQVSSFAYITSNWERNDSDGFDKIGTGMSESSGEFSFPSTGVYLVRMVINWYASGGGVNYNRIGIYTTIDNSTYTERAFSWSGVESSSQYNNMMAEILFDVTDVSTHKLKFQTGASNTRPRVRGETNYNASYATFIRLGDT